ncbi:MAG: alkaline phosphatase family protein [Acidimicrobiales bacterium]|nr:alkaline phosphatase family protein [Acidimicrobiales bacterium]
MLPDYGGACLSNVVPVLLARARGLPAWVPPELAEARQVVLLVLDGLGWEQLRARSSMAPTLDAMAGGAICTVVPSTTATALTSLATGLPPGEHGVVGYRIDVHGEVLNVLRWSTPGGDARRSIPPGDFQAIVPFLGTRVPVVTKAEFEGSGFSAAHLAGVEWHGWRVPSTLVLEVRKLVASGEPFVYAYYEGIDKVAHEYGLDEHYDSELAFVDRLVGDLCGLLPPGAALVVTSDHGQVDVGDNVRPLAPEVLRHCELLSGEGRFRWLHALPGHASELLEAARAAHGDEAWVMGVEEAVLAGWFGPRVLRDAADRLGDVLVAARSDVSFDDPADTGPYELVGRHGSLTPAEMLVPLLSVSR